MWEGIPSKDFCSPRRNGFTASGNIKISLHDVSLKELIKACVWDIRFPCSRLSLFFQGMGRKYNGETLAAIKHPSITKFNYLFRIIGSTW